MLLKGAPDSRLPDTISEGININIPLLWADGNSPKSSDGKAALKQGHYWAWPIGGIENNLTPLEKLPNMNQND